jgi:hypothetical protein
MLIELLIRILLSIANQFTEKDLVKFVNRFPKEVGEKIGQAIQGNVSPIKSWLQESSKNVSTLSLELIKKDKEISFDGDLLKMEEIVKVVLTSIELTKKPVLIKEFFGNTNYISLWQVSGYIHDAYHISGNKIHPNFQFEIFVFPNEGDVYNRLLKKIRKGQGLSNRDYQNGFKVSSVSPNISLINNKHWLGKIFKKSKKIEQNLNLSSFFNMLNDVEEHNSLLMESQNFWDKVKNVFQL